MEPTKAAPPPAATDSPEDLPRKIGLIAFLLVFVIAAGVVPMLSPDIETPKPTAHLSDHRAIVLEATTFGTRHVVKKGSPWKSWLRPKLPRSWRGLLGAEIRNWETHTTREYLIPWLSIDPGTKGKSISWNNIHIVSDSGQAFDIGGRGNARTPDGRAVTQLHAEVFPRRDRSFSLTGLVDRLPWSLRIDNPIFERPVTEWLPGRMPATNRLGDLSLILQPSDLHLISSGISLDLRTEIHRESRLPTDHYATSWSLADATGNNGHEIPTNEPAWKIDFTIWRTAAAPWTTNEYRDFAVPDLPAAGRHRIIQVDDDINGVRVERLWLGGPGTYEVENGRVTKEAPLAPGQRNSSSSSSSGAGHWKMKWSRTNPWIRCETARTVPGQRISVFVTDADGRPVNVNHTGSSWAGWAYLKNFELKPSWKQITAAHRKDRHAAPPTTADLSRPPYTFRIAVQTDLTTSFLIDPADLKTVNHRKPTK